MVVEAVALEVVQQAVRVEVVRVVLLRQLEQQAQPIRVAAAVAVVQTQTTQAVRVVQAWLFCQFLPLIILA